ncbi:MAG: aspartyl-tRNA synthetase [Parcubacteria group bacterium Greene0714_21]|nr:MAG: aspartyl-tRNA synthetase [Parcubacteria group bacterium Greene0416_39]TSC97779.1 MAG: aspartyl-tRNA synthetase [Parcubacteria group bacterium Greene1014_47]TSD04253.1 MAG: aspartyl-tRNA synthetase [Parcubacteria group bacterium Greene0714_21]
MKRTFTNKILAEKGSKVQIAGWIATRRDHGKIIFLDVRDMTGTVQVVCSPELAKSLRPEWVVEIEGTVKERPDAMKNSAVETGDIEIAAEKIAVLSEAKTLPFAIDTNGYEIGEEKRLQYRYLDLRRPRLKRNIEIRNRVTQFIREFLVKEGFIEIETPILTKSTPEGARDFLVPSRMYSGKFYALPQSPQQYKQLLQVAGFERYFQIARCFRDEDPRGDRQPEFTQLDIEMSFVEQEDMLRLFEELYTKVVEELFPEKRIIQTPFPRISYKEAMAKWGSDKPDLRKDKSSPNELAFAFIVDFPMFEWKEKEGRWDAVHHPFTRPQTEDIEEVKKDPANVLAYQYDLALNGYEVAGGSLRTYKPEFLRQVLEFMGNTKEEVQEKFGHLFEAFEYGVPPHGGIAAGLERFLAVLLNEPNIREVMVFPKTGDSRDLMMDSPSEISPGQLKELSLEIKKRK